jgi:cytochrome P450
VVSCVLAGKVKLTEEELVEGILVLQMAGSITTSSALVNSIYRLATHKEIQNELQKEIDDAVPRNRSLEISYIEKLPFLEAFINEVLRMHPPIPSGLVRETPPEGLRIDDVDIPGNVVVTSPTWTLHHGTYFTLSPFHNLLHCTPNFLSLNIS